MGTLARRVLFACGILIVLLVVLLPWSSADWTFYVIKKWGMGGLGLTLVLGGAFLMYRKTSTKSKRNIEGFRIFLKYMSFSGLVVSIALFFFGSWNRVVILSLGVAINSAVFLYTLGVAINPAAFLHTLGVAINPAAFLHTSKPSPIANDFRVRSHLALAILLLTSFLAIILSNFILTALVYIAS